MLLTSSFRLENQSPELKSLVNRYVFLASLIRAILILSDTFLIIFVIDNVGYAQAGFLVSIMLITQSLIDYPSGILSDRIGQRWILALAFLSYAGSYFFFSNAETLNEFIFAYLLLAFASAQESGALDTWFDNNYKVLADDPDREIYKGIRARFRTIVDLAGAAMLVTGGYLATTIGRKIVFELQLIGMIALALITLYYVNDTKGARETKPRRYSELFMEGLTAVAKSRLLALLVIANVLYYSTLGVFGTLIMFPGYFGYTGTDLGASIFRFVLFIGGSFLLWVLADWFRKINSRKWLGPVSVIHGVFFFGFSGMILLIIPIQNKFDVIGILLFGSAIMVGHMIRVAIDIFLQSIYVDVIPNHRRNGFYSLLPTLSLLVSSPLMFLAGFSIQRTGHVPVIWGLLILSTISGLIFWKASTYLPNLMSNINEPSKD